MTLGRHLTRKIWLGCLFACAAWLMCGAALVTAMAQETVASAKEATKTSGTTSKSPIAVPKKTTPSTTHSKSSSSAASRKGKSTYASSRHGKRKTAARGQQKIDPERAQEIQEALVREHYLSGAAVGTWNQASEDAMRRYQADHGWQSKTVPDSRALISLGLGPSHDHLLNPDSAMTGEPAASHTVAPAAAPLVPVSSPSPAAKVQPDSTTGSQSGLGDSSRPQ
jgi:hypothetical protein